MKDGLATFNRLCHHCGKAAHISKFMHKGKACHYCYDCRQHLYVRCDICLLRKKRSEMAKIEESSAICKKCDKARDGVQNDGFNEAFNILDNLIGKDNELHTDKTV